MGVILKGGPGVQIDGSGTAANPYQISSTFADLLALKVQDSATVNLTLTGAGTTDDPYVLRADSGGTIGLEDLVDGNPVNGSTPVWIGDGATGGFEFRPMGTRYVTSTGRPANPWVGLEIHETDTGLWKEWDGTAWISKTGSGGGGGGAFGDLTGTILDSQLPARLQATAKVLSGVSVNTALETGWYRGTGLTDAPGTGWYWYEVIRHSATYVIQFAHGFPGDYTTYRRHLNNGVWGAWAKYVDTGNATAILGGQFAALTGGKVSRAALPFASASGHKVFSSLTAVNGGYGQTIHVAFPAGRFATSPEVVASAHTEANSPQTVGCVNVTKDGFDLHYWRDSYQTGVWVSWIANDEG